MPFGPVVAGQFYTDNPKLLADQIDRFLQEAAVPEIGGGLFGLISPHAGYVYSGACAAHAFKPLKGRTFDVVIVIGLSHRAPGGISVLDDDSYRTPLGELKIDRETTAKLLAGSDLVDSNRELFLQEHSVEVQLPFLQRVLKDPKVVLVSMRTMAASRCRRLAEELDRAIGPRKALVVASSDLSHFYPYDEARDMDLGTLELVRSLDIDGLSVACEKGSGEMCGIAPVLTLLHLFRLRGGGDVEILKYMNSGDTAGDRDSVVGYGSVALVTGNGKAKTMDNETASPGEITAEDRRLCLRIARQSIEAYVKRGEVLKFGLGSPALQRDGAAFVSLHLDQELRGCVGHVDARVPLWQCVRDMAIAAATEDPRFPAVTEEEIPRLTIEVSVLSPAQRLAAIGDIVIGRDGLMVARDYYRGLLLPQVATRYGWDVEEFLDNTCVKAGLPPGAWKDSKTEVKTFRAEVFAEHGPARH